MSIYKDRMNNVTMGVSPEELAGRIARGVPKSETRKSFYGIRKISAIAAGAAAAAVLTVTAGAINGWDFNAAVRSLFKVETVESVYDKTADIEVSALVNGFDDVEFNFLGAVSDDIFTTLFLEVTRTDGGVFDFEDNPTVYMDPDGNPVDVLKSELFGTDSVPGYDYNKHGTGFYCGKPKLMDDGNDSDGKLTYALVYDTDMLKSYADSNDSVSVQYDIYGIGYITYSDIGAFMDFYGDWEADNDGVNFNGIKGHMSAEVTIPFNDGGAVNSVSPDAPLTLDTYGNIAIGEFTDHPEAGGQKEFTLDKISVSTASVSFEASAEIYGEDCPWLDMKDSELIRISMKDGTGFSVGDRDVNKMRNEIYGGKLWRIKYDCMLGRIIDPEDVESVTINGQTFAFASDSETE